ncbi:hypothetical protein NP167_18275, partial [Salmonella enterica]|nr:hypothetical protein [Salmonella enterica]
MVLLNSLPCNYLSLVDVLSYSGERMVMADDSRFFLMGTVAKLAMRQPFVLFKGLTFQKLCLP